MDKDLFTGNYDVPRVEIIEICVEQGFAASQTWNGIDGMPEHEI